VVYYLTNAHERVNCLCPLTMCSVRLSGLNLDKLTRKQTHCRCHSQK